MTLTTLILVAIAFALLNFTAIVPVWVGSVFSVGCLVNVIDAAHCADQAKLGISEWE